jgi:outer membrane receptor for ferrienterochelin and colicins
MPATITIRQRALSGWSLRSWLCCSLVLFATCLQAQTVCGPVLIEADELLHKGFFSDLENLLAPCLAVEATREERVEAYRILVLASMATENYGRARELSDALLRLRPDYEASFLDSPKFARLLDRIRASWLDPTQQAVVTATKHEQKIGEAPAVISLITSRQIEQYGYASVGEALSTLSGVDMLHDQVQYNLGVRGINAGMRGSSRIVKVMIEGQSVAFRPSSENFLGTELVPMQAVDRIEVVRGPSSTLYGANAYLGVVNIIMRRGERIDGMELRSGVSSVQGHAAYDLGLLYGRKMGRVDYLLAASGQFADRSGLHARDLPGDSRYRDQELASRNDISRPASLYARAEIEGHNDDRLAVDLSLQQLDTFGEFQDWGVLTGINRISMRNLFLRSRYDRPLFGLHATVAAAYSQGEPCDDEFLAINQAGVGDWITREVGYEGVDLSSELSWEGDVGNVVTVGIDHSRDAQELQTYYRHYFDQDSQATGLAQGDTAFVNTGAYAQAVVYPFRALHLSGLTNLGLTTGWRYDRHNIYDDISNYRIAGAYPLTGNWYAKVIYGTSFKAPSPVQLYTTLIVPQGVLGNPELRPETARTWEAAVGGRLSSRITITLVGFSSDVRNKVELVPSGANTRADNVAKISSRGFEEETFYRSENTTAYLNLSYQHSTDRRVDRLRGVLEGDTNLYPRTTVKFGANRQLQRWPWELSLSGIYSGERIASEQNIKNFDPINLQEYKLDGYLLLDLTLQSRILGAGRGATLQLKISNLLDEQYYYPGFRDFDIPGLGRRFSASLTYHL